MAAGARRLYGVAVSLTGGQVPIRMTGRSRDGVDRLDAEGVTHAAGTWRGDRAGASVG